MELRQNTRLATTRPIAWVVAVLIALMFGLLGGYVLASSALTRQTGIGAPPIVSVESPRIGGPGGQLGDAPLPDQTSRAGGPGGQIGDASLAR
jgi:hypothetical protein